MQTIQRHQRTALPVQAVAVWLLVFTGITPLNWKNANAAPTMTPTWSRSFDAFAHQDVLLATAPSGGGGMLQLVRSHSPTDGSTHLITLRYADDGALIWRQDESFSRGAKHAMKTAGDGTTILVIAERFRLLLRKFDSTTGATVWERQRNLSNSVEAGSIMVAALARDAQFSQILIAVPDQDDFLIARYTEDGDALPDIRWGIENSVDVPTAIGVRSDGGFVVAGFENTTAIEHTAYRTLGFDAAGNPIFSHREVGPRGSLFTPAWLTLDRADNVYVVGGPESTCGLFLVKAWKLDAIGQHSWSYSAPTNPCDNFEPLGFSVLPDGDLVIVGKAELAKFGLIRLNQDGLQDWKLAWGGAAGGNHATSESFAVNDEGRIRVGGFQSAGSTSNLQLAEWTSEGQFCGSHLGVENSNATTIVPWGTDWAVGSNSRFTAATNVDAVLTRWPALDCAVNAIFADAFESTPTSPVLTQPR